MFSSQPFKEGNILTRIWGWIKGYFMLIGLLTTASCVIMVMALSKAAQHMPAPLPKDMVLTYTFAPGLLESVTTPSLEQPLLLPPTTFSDITGALADAAKDPRVKGLIINIAGLDMSLAQIQEVRDAITQLNAAGKFTAAFTEDFGDGSAGMGEYYLASAFGQIWLQPVGGVTITGISSDTPFAKTLLDKLGITAELLHRGDYKSAPESLTRTDMSEPHRDMIVSLIGNLSGQLIDGIAAGRKLAPDTVKYAINNAPYTDNEALAMKLIDKVGYYDELLDMAESTTQAEAVTLARYMFDKQAGSSALFDRSQQKLPQVALITATGTIMSSQRDSFGGIAADQLAANITAAADNDDVAAIILRIDSPGGSPSAAETVHRAISLARKSGTPVIISMGGAAASGGYWIATAADKIVAQPATMTGSIGVFGGKIVLKDMWEKLGITWESISEGDNAGMWSTNDTFTPAEKARMEAIMDNIYDAFIDRVAAGRNLPRDLVVSIAGGRVWTGKQAIDKGLVDALGGIDVAASLAKEALGLTADDKVALVHFPPKKSALELFMQMATEGGGNMPAVRIDARDILQSLGAELKAVTAPVRVSLPDVTQ